MAVDSMLRGQHGRKLEASDFTTRHLSGRSVRVLAFGLPGAAEGGLILEAL
jgi:hypothetical protein